MSDGRDLYARVSFIPYLLALSLVVTWYAHHELFKGVDTWSFWTDFWGANRTQLEPRKWAKWTLAGLLFVGSFELFRRFDWFFRPTPGSALPDPDEKSEETEDDAPRSAEKVVRDKERQRVRDERKREREERKRQRTRKREKDKARREQAKKDDLRKRSERAAKERARKVREAAEETAHEEDRKVADHLRRRRDLRNVAH